MRLVAVVGLAVGGCQVLFDLEPKPVEIETVTGTLVDARIVNGPGGVPERVNLPYPPASVVAQAAFDDGTQVTFALADDGSFTFERPPGATYELSMFASGQETILRHDALAPRLMVATVGRANRDPITVATFVDLPGASAGQAKLASTGLWASAPLSPNANSIDWRVATSAGGPLGLVRASKHDVLYHYSYGSLPEADPVARTITALGSAMVEMTDGGRVAAPTLDPITAFDCVRLTMPLTAEVERLREVRPDATVLVADWQLFAFAEPDFGVTGAQLLAEAHDGMADRVNAGVDVRYANRFPGTRLYAGMRVVLVHGVRFPGANPLSVVLQSQHFAEAVGTGVPCAAVPALTPMVGTPHDWQIGDVILGAEHQTVPISRVGRVPVTFTVAGTGTLFAVTLQEVKMSNGQTSLGAPIATMRAARPAFAFAEALFEPGRSYVLTTIHSDVYPMAVEGDLRTVAYPGGLVTAMSPVFTIAAP